MAAASRYAEAVQALERLTIELTERDIVQQGVNIAQRATGSRIAYLHFLNENQNSIELGVWSDDTLAGCKAVYARHYPIDAAGIWADSARSRAPCVHNDYEAVAEKRGLPRGHSRLLRHLGLPVVEGGLVRLLVGVGNKDSDYDQHDIDALDMVARRVWSVTRQRRLLERYLDIGQRFRHVQEIASVSGLEYDIDEDSLAFDGQFASIFRTRHATETPATLHALLAFVAHDDHDRVRRAFADKSAGRQALRIGCLRRTGEHFPAELKIECRPRELGRGLIWFGILQDVSDQEVAADLRRRADHDPLTGLPNRHRLHAWFRQGGRRASGERFAFHYVDLDRFKPVNDNWGHLVGDEVLREIAQRLQQSVRHDDLVVRMGGDEFVVVQPGVQDAAAAAGLAQKILDAIDAPIVALGQQVRVGACIGIALCGGRPCELHEISAEADRALYQAKAAGGNQVVISVGGAAGAQPAAMPGSTAER